MKITPDKRKHFFVGILMGAVLQAFAAWLLRDHLLIAAFIAFIMVIAVSYGFELFSLLSGKGHYDFIDAVASAVGGLLGMGVVIMFQLV